MNDISPQKIESHLIESHLKGILLDAVPWGVLVLDENACVLWTNRFVEKVFGVRTEEAIGKGAGNVLGCLRAMENEKGCGLADGCDDCEIRRIAKASIRRDNTQKARVRFQMIAEGEPRDVDLMVIAMPVEIDGRACTAMILQNISSLETVDMPETPSRFRGIVGNDPKMREMFETIRDFAHTNASVLIQGESGTGKELAALAIHKESARSDKHFVPFNCGALPESLVESELFGHVKGAFTSAIRDKKGRFELAHGGTLFLDEVGELKPSVQVKLLRVLQEGRFERLGGERTIGVDVRVISATNRNLEEEVAAGRFRADLFYRLCVMPLHIPPLRQRGDDIRLLAEFFIRLYARERGVSAVNLSDEILEIFANYDWPGNVRELQNVIQYALAKSRGDTILAEHLPPAIHWTQWKPPKNGASKTQITIQKLYEALRETDGNKKEAAKRLGVSRSTLYRFLAKEENRAN